MIYPIRNSENLKNVKIDDIEILRAIAIIFTLIHHTAYFLLLQPNWLLENLYDYVTFWGGVDLFFVISGFVIMRSLQLSLERYSKSVSTTRIFIYFWIKRFWRILPAAWFWGCLFLLAACFFNSTNAFGDFEDNLKESFSWFFQYANYHGYLCTQAVTKCGVNGIYWSLSLEEQFYILLPISILVFRKYLPLFLIVALMALFFNERPHWSLGWAFRFDPFIWGILIALFTKSSIYKKIDLAFLKHLPVRIPLILTLISALALIPNPENHLILKTSFVGITAAILVLIASFNRNYFSTLRPLNKVLLWFGSRSYSIYLIHIITFRASYEILSYFVPENHKYSSADAIPVLLISFTLLGLLSEFSYQMIEKKMRAYGSSKAIIFLQREIEN